MMLFRRLSARERIVWSALGAISVVFHIWLVVASALLPNLVTRPLHMALALPFVFILAARTRIELWTGTVFAVLGVAACLYVARNSGALADQYGFIENDFQFLLAAVLLVVVLEMARRSAGWPLPLVACIALVYGLFGQYVPGEFGHPGVPWSSMLGTLTIAEGGIWGSLTGVSVSIVSVFVIFGAVLNAGEAGQGFMNLAVASAGKLRGGAAKVSVISSALFGSISGSASANVASTGAITLPTMVRLGYPKSLAAAVEAVASSGGQIMPPLMGAGAFVMVELTGIPYTAIISAALFPALLFFFAVWVGIDVYAGRYNLVPMDAEGYPALKTVLITAGFFAIPFAILLLLMFWGGYTPQYAGSIAIMVSVLLLFFEESGVGTWKQTIDRIENSVMNAGRQIGLIASIILCASIIIGILSITGLGVKITSLILSGSGGYLWPALLLTGVACLILGMEVPTTAAYVICVSVAGPALQNLGLEPLPAHLFVFWFALLSTITPPVCGAVFIAAGMIGENWLKVAFTAMALGVGLYIIPLGMIANPQLLNMANEPLYAVLALIKVGAGLVLVSNAVIGKRGGLVRLGMAIAGLLVIFLRPMHWV